MWPRATGDSVRACNQSTKFATKLPTKEGSHGHGKCPNRPLAHFRRRESFAISPREDLVVGLLVVGEAEVGRVPTQFLAWKSGGFDRQQRGLSDAPANGQRCPKRLARPEAIVCPIFPVVARGHFGHGLVLHHFALTED